MAGSASSVSTVATTRPPMIAVAMGPQNTERESGIMASTAAAAVETATQVYLAQRQDGERFLDTYRRIGMAPFKEALYG